MGRGGDLDRGLAQRCSLTSLVACSAYPSSSLFMLRLPFVLSRLALYMCTRLLVRA